jgi:hypothetical protein
MNRGDEEVKTHAPEVEPSKIAEGRADCIAVIVSPFPSIDEEDRSEDVESKQAAKRRKDIRG